MVQHVCWSDLSCQQKSRIMHKTHKMHQCDVLGSVFRLLRAKPSALETARERASHSAHFMENLNAQEILTLNEIDDIKNDTHDEMLFEQVAESYLEHPTKKAREYSGECPDTVASSSGKDDFGLTGLEQDLKRRIASFLPRIDAVCLTRACKAIYLDLALSTLGQEPFKKYMPESFETKEPCFVPDKPANVSSDFVRWRGLDTLLQQIADQHQRVSDQLKRHQKFLDRRASF